MTIDSALSQTYPNKEIIVIDDGSTDSSPEIIKSFGSAILAEFRPNQGASAARNRGTELARGQYVQYLDADDILLPDTVAKRVDALDATGLDIVYTDWQQITSPPDGTICRGAVIAQPLSRLEDDAEAACASSAFWAPPAAILYRRWVVDAVGAWNTRLAVVQDARFLFDAARAGARFKHLEGVGALYRISSNSLSRRSHKDFIKDCFVNALEIEAIWSDGGLTGARRQTLIQIWEHLAVSSFRANLPEFRKAYNHLRTLSDQAHMDLGLRIVLSSVFAQSTVWAIEQKLRKLLRPLRRCPNIFQLVTELHKTKS
jgi:glycosyltransferase involved in cell wall biosynthesis